MDIRKELRNALIEREELHKKIQSLSAQYLNSNPDRYIYVSDHALVRYLERVMDIELKGDTDTEKLRSAPFSPEHIRKFMMSKADEIEIVSKGKNFHETEECVLVCRALTIVTVMNKEGNKNDME